MLSRNKDTLKRKKEEPVSGIKIKVEQGIGARTTLFLGFMCI